jgi:hypothetical protein
LFDSGPAEEKGGRELVVGREQTEWRVHYLHAPTLQPRQPPKPRLDPVEGRQDIEPRDRDIAWANARRRSGVGELYSEPKLGKSPSQTAIRLRRLTENDERTTRICLSHRPRRHALAPFDRELDV